MKDHATTIYDISELAGVSIATVSRVLNGSPNVSDATRKKVLDAIEASGYTPNAFARGLGLNTMKTIGILAADSSDLYLAKAIYHLERELRANDYDCLLCCTGYELENRKSAIDLLISKKVDGIILVGSNFIYDTDEENAYIVEAARTVPVMLLNGALEAPNVYSITSDDYKSMYEAASELIDSGVTNILYYYNSISYSGKRKEKGFRSALKDRGVTVPENHFQYFDGTREDVPGMAAQLLTLHKKGVTFDGVIAADDTLAMSAVKYARTLGLSIPEEFSVIGYNNSMLSTCSDPELSSIDNKLETLCQHLTATLMGVLGGADMPKITVFSGEIAHRMTTRPKTT
ncbi:MAG: LacI family transcriptional regulator [Lachnospiraceae bacterium]|nr:LacI family transcriptional regulator [Lachnospiraceae bacterium]